MKILRVYKEDSCWQIEFKPDFFSKKCIAAFRIIGPNNTDWEWVRRDGVEISIETGNQFLIAMKFAKAIGSIDVII